MRTSDFVLQIAKKEQNYLIKVINETVKCTECTKSKMNGFDFICTEFHDLIVNNEVMCSEFEKKEVSND